ncbi:MAG: hypothetical protein KatS3mg001_399 [Candidatus Pacearchaeota archaeon]|nr:MAG: hypothetical protein KatS3mg001_399 [Candidatus Pacearchaeota archaeon]
MKTKKSIKIISIATTALFIVVFLLSFLFKSNIKAYFNKNLEKHGAVFIFLYGLLVELIPNYLSPHVSIIASKLIGINFLISTLFLISGSTLGSLIGFFIGKEYGIKLSSKIYSKNKIKKIRKAINKKGKMIILLAAISPIPYLPIVFGSLHLSLKNFFVFGILPRILGILAFSLIVYT